jgi:hypothetical protein
LNALARSQGSAQSPIDAEVLDIGFGFVDLFAELLYVESGECAARAHQPAALLDRLRYRPNVDAAAR